MSEFKKKILETLAGGFMPNEPLNVWQWAEKYITLPSGTTPRPGPYNTSWCPYVREPMERYTDPSCRKITACFATRSAKTEMFMMMLRYTVANEHQACMWGKPNQTDADRDSELRFQPTIESSEVLRRLKPTSRHQYRKAMMKFKTAPVFFVGMGSHAAVKNKQIGRMFLDEIDESKKANERQTSSLQNAYERVKDTPNPKICQSSTPTVASAQIWTQFLLGDQRFYYVPCWWCNEFFRFKLDGVRWSDEARQADGAWNLEIVKETVHYECPHCKKKILDGHKLTMLKSGQWRPTIGKDRLTLEGRTMPPEEGHYSYHLNSIYPEWMPFYRFAFEFLTSKNNPDAWQSFINQWLAEPYFYRGNTDEMQTALANATTIVELAENKPPPGWKALMHLDVQQMELWCRIRMFNEQRESVGVYFGMLAGFDDARELQKRFGVSFVGVDLGYADRREETLYAISKYAPSWHGTWGTGTMYAAFKFAGVPIAGGNLKGFMVPCLKVNPLCFKEILTSRIKGEPPSWKNEPSAGEIYKKQMAGEYRHVKRLPNGGQIISYPKVGANHAWDNEYNLLAMYEFHRGTLFGMPSNFVQKPAPVEIPVKVSESIDRDEERRDPEVDRDNVWAGE